MNAFSRFVWLDAQLAEAIQSYYRSGQPGWDDYRFARSAARDIQSLGDSGDGLCSATLLVRSVTDLAIRAHLARSGAPVDASTPGDECWARLSDAPVAHRICAEFSKEQLEIVVSVLASDGKRFLTQQPLSKLRLILSTMRDLADALLEPLDAEASRVRRVRTQRWTRVSVILIVAVIVESWIWHKITARPNLALNKVVTIMQPDAQWTKDPNGLVDGNRDELGFHTIQAPHQTATINLGKPQRISRVVVFNRTDCCQDRAVPLKIDVSEDGKAYKTVAERRAPFQASFVAEFPKTTARYVRMTNLQNAYFHLNEVEVY